MAQVKFEIPRLAAPSYLTDKEADIYKDAPPGHKYFLYFMTSTVTGSVSCNDHDRDTKRYLERISEQGNLEALENHGISNRNDWDNLSTKKSQALKKTLSIPSVSRQQIEAIQSRQFALVSAAPENSRLTLEAQSTSPLATGMGMEHPLENGFAFLNPYGLPYLPGSSIKGVLRQAARELGWDEAVISVLFGREVESGDTTTQQRTRGVLTFWDVIPELAGNALGMDVMTPHYGTYYQGASTPHDAGSPNPIVFMVIPAGARFSFHITADKNWLHGMDDWQTHMQAAFEYAFKWLGFGAKTAVGYGAMFNIETLEVQKKEQQAQAALADAKFEEGVYLKENSRNKSLFIERSHRTLGTAAGKQVGVIREQLTAEERKQFEKKGAVKVNAYVRGNEIIKISSWTK